MYKINILGIVDKANLKHEKFGEFVSFLANLTDNVEVVDGLVKPLKNERDISLDDKWVTKVDE
jgi:hypothetical protein